MYRKSILLPIISAMLAFTGAGAASADDNLKVATWNIEHLSGQDGAGCRSRNQAAYDQIRSTINKIDADIWLFQEIEGAGALSRVMDGSQWTFIVEDRPDWERQPDCENGKPMTMQRAVIAVRKGITITGRDHLRFLDLSGYGSLRQGVGVSIAHGGQEVEIVNVHLKAGCTEGHENTACTDLFMQAPYLSTYLTRLAEAGNAIIVGGDFNRRLADQGDAVMASLTYNVALGLEIATPQDVSECSNLNAPPIDYILTDHRFRENYRTVETLEGLFDGHYSTWPSDHCPIVASFQLK